MYRAAGRVGITALQLYELTPREFYEFSRGVGESRLDDYKATAELNRQLTALLVNTQLKQPIPDAKKLIKFAWEVEKPRKLTGEELERIKRM